MTKIIYPMGRVGYSMRNVITQILHVPKALDTANKNMFCFICFAGSFHSSCEFIMIYLHIFFCNLLHCHWGNQTIASTREVIVKDEGKSPPVKMQQNADHISRDILLLMHNVQNLQGEYNLVYHEEAILISCTTWILRMVENANTFLCFLRKILHGKS